MINQSSPGATAPDPTAGGRRRTGVLRRFGKGGVALAAAVALSTALASTALATTAMFIGSIFTPWAVVWGSIPIFITMTAWFWPKTPDEGGTQAWPIRHRTLPLPNEATEGALP